MLSWSAAWPVHYISALPLEMISSTHCPHRSSILSWLKQRNGTPHQCINSSSGQMALSLWYEMQLLLACFAHGSPRPTPLGCATYNMQCSTCSAAWPLRCNCSPSPPTHGHKGLHATPHCERIPGMSLQGIGSRKSASLGCPCRASAAEKKDNRI